MTITDAPLPADSTPSLSPNLPLSKQKRPRTPDRARVHDPMAERDSPFGPDSARRRSMIDRCTLGAIADPWRKLPWGWRWRSSPWFLTTLVGLGISTDILTYTIVVPILPYRLQAQGYTNVANLTSYLLIAYSAGLTIATPFVSFIFHRYPYRRAPLLLGLVILQLSLVLFMLAEPFWCAMVSRVLQGAASAIVWSVGMALICENVEPEVVGRQLGFAISGVSVGGSLGPVIGGALYDKMGWHAPFVFCICICAVDFVGRLLLVERKELARWGIGMDGEDIDVASTGNGAIEKVNPVRGAEENSGGAEREDDLQAVSRTPTISPARPSPIEDGKTSSEEKPALAPADDHTEAELSKVESEGPKREKHLSPFQVLAKLFSSPRAVTGLSLVFCFALAISSMDPVLTLRIEQVWKKDSLFVGLIYLCASIPTFFTGPIFGHLSDKLGAEMITAPLILLTLPWTPLLTFSSSLAAFIVFFTIWNGALSAVIAPVGQELAMVSKQQEGISEIHQFGAFNMAFSIGSLIGPFFGGQIYDAIGNGWTILCWLWLAFMALPLLPVLLYTGERPLWRRVFDKGYRTKEARQMTADGRSTDVPA